MELKLPDMEYNEFSNECAEEFEVMDDLSFCACNSPRNCDISLSFSSSNFFALSLVVCICD